MPSILTIPCQRWTPNFDFRIVDLKIAVIFFILTGYLGQRNRLYVPTLGLKPQTLSTK